MSRSVLGPKKIAELQKRFPEVAIEKAWSRGNTGHRLDLCLTDGTLAYLWPDGTLERSDDRWRAAGKD